MQDKMQIKKNNTSTPYDDAHRTMLNDCPWLIIPVVNEMFQKKHSDKEKITVLNNEFFLNKQDGEQAERITDTNFMIGSDRYHLECQSTPDGTIMYRVFEYDSQIALQSSEILEDKLIVKFPNTAVLYLRHNKRTPEKMTMEIRVPGATCSYPVPILKVQNYTIEEIFAKDLLFLIPFHIFLYEKDFKEYESNENRLEELICLYEEIMDRLNSYAIEQRIDEYTKRTIIDMSKKVLEHLAKKYSNVKERVGAIMGGKILDYEAKDILNAGRAEGDKARLFSQVQKKLAKNKSVEVIAEELEEELEVIVTLVEEIALNEADRLAETTDIRYSHEEVFEKIRNRVNK